MLRISYQSSISNALHFRRLYLRDHNVNRVDAREEPLLKLEFQNILEALRQSKMGPIVPKTTSVLH